MEKIPLVPVVRKKKHKFKQAPAWERIHFQSEIKKTEEVAVTESSKDLEKEGLEEKYILIESSDEEHGRVNEIISAETTSNNYEEKIIKEEVAQVRTITKNAEKEELRTEMETSNVIVNESSKNSEKKCEKDTIQIESSDDEKDKAPQKASVEKTTDDAYTPTISEAENVEKSHHRTELEESKGVTLTVSSKVSKLRAIIPN
ncbi:hypothetical protein JTB14_027173 [Gonioctena quinquepunctata]|nr:hypothetical protein JTB14_027173 [Gonioctena quinquepunctata]